MDSLPCMSTYSPNLFAGRAFPEIPQHQYLALAVAPLPGPFDTAALTETYSDHRFQSQGAPVYSNLSRTLVVPSAPPTAFFPRDHMQATQFDGNPTHMRYVVSSATRPPLRRKDSYYSYMPPDLHVSYGRKLGHMGDSAHFKECRGSSHAMSFGVRAATGIPVTTENLNPMADEFNFSRDLSETGREIEKYDSQEDLNSNGKAAASASSSSPVNDPDQTKNQRELRKTLQAPPSKIGEVHGPDIDHPPEFKIDSHIMYDGGVTPDIGKGFIDSCKHCLRKSLHIRSPTADENDSKESVKVQVSLHQMPSLIDSLALN
ncbi:hypothetical protein PtB15_10B524 [Puccinia triticina]|nr:hypothetical protein PtB15_10B524 [Puccinia triticina]